MSKLKYIVLNKYNVNGETRHKSPENALKARDTREGDGWIVKDTNGQGYDWNLDKQVILID